MTIQVGTLRNVCQYTGLSDRYEPGVNQVLTRYELGVYRCEPGVHKCNSLYIDQGSKTLFVQPWIL